MIYLILAILCSAGVSIFMRASEKYCQGHYGILLMNYVVCVLAGLILTGRGLTQTDGKGMPVTIVFGVVTGLLYCGSFIPVSYTHLDVYKRQGRFFRNCKIGERKTDTERRRYSVNWIYQKDGA